MFNLRKQKYPESLLAEELAKFVFRIGEDHEQIQSVCDDIDVPIDRIKVEYKYLRAFLIESVVRTIVDEGRATPGLLAAFRQSLSEQIRQEGFDKDFWSELQERSAVYDPLWNTSPQHGLGAAMTAAFAARIRSEDDLLYVAPLWMKATSFAISLLEFHHKIRIVPDLSVETKNRRTPAMSSLRNGPDPTMTDVTNGGDLVAGSAVPRAFSSKPDDHSATIGLPVMLIPFVIGAKAIFLSLPAIGIIATSSIGWNIFWWVIWLSWMWTLCLLDAKRHGLTTLVGFVYWLVPAVMFLEQPWFTGRVPAYLIGGWTVICLIGIWRDHRHGPTQARRVARTK